MVLNLLVLGVCFYNLFLIANVIEDGMKEIKFWDNANKNIEYVKGVAENNCGSKFNFSFDRETFLMENELSELSNSAMNNVCGDTFEAINELCVDAVYYKTMTRIKSVSCGFDKKITNPAVTLKAGHLQFAYNWGTSNHSKTVKEYLKKNL